MRQTRREEREDDRYAGRGEQTDGERERDNLRGRETHRESQARCVRKRVKDT